MYSFSPNFRRLAAASFGAVAALSICAADTNTNNIVIPPTKRNAPKGGQQINFSSPSATAPALPSPSARTDALKERGSPVQENSVPTMAPSGGSLYTAPAAPTKAFKEKMLQQMDRNKNWLFPGSQDEMLGLSNWESKGLDSEDLQPDAKNQTVMERFLSGAADNRNKPRFGKESKNNRNLDDSELNRENNSLNSALEPPSQQEPNGISDFNLRSALTGGPQRSDPFSRKEGDSMRTFQPLPGTLLGAEAARKSREREKDRERDILRATEFQQMIRPRNGNMNAFTDPINSAPDFTRREINPIMPRVVEQPSVPQASPFGGPASAGNFRIGDSGLFGAATPSGGGFSPPSASFSANPVPQPSRSIILEPPKRKFQ
jgi:hypothetical protein